MSNLIRRKPSWLFSPIVRRFGSIRDTSRVGFNDEPRDDADGNNPPQPIPNRPLRGQRPQTRSHPLSQSQSHFTPRFVPKSSTPTNTHQNQPLSNDDFLQKFRLRLDNNSSKSVKENNPPSHPSNGDDHSSRSNSNSECTPSPPPDADDIFKKMKETGLIPNAVAMLDGLCKDGLIQEAMKLFGLMREKGTIPQVVVYTAVVDGFFKALKPDDAKRIFHKMIDNGITPNAFTYGVLIQGLYKCDKLDDAVYFCFRMLEAGHSPNVSTFVGLVEGLCKEKSVEEAQSVVEDLKKKGFYINDKAIRDFLDRNAPLSSDLPQAIFGKKPSRKPF